MGLYGTQLVKGVGWGEGDELDVIGWFTQRNALAIEDQIGLKWPVGGHPSMYKRGQ